MSNRSLKYSMQRTRYQRQPILSKFRVQMARMKLQLASKDLSIKVLQDRLERGEEAAHAKHLREELELCQREQELGRKARMQLEQSLEQLNTTFMVLRQNRLESRGDFILMQVGSDIIHENAKK